ncbi:MAG TPA: hypothetical protein VFE05_14980 [Longimicrobiaceae bacterium]|jgi:hypothetical protein|nr:hypothetical protein [Longimicrobiaceae bacterium]
MSISLPTRRLALPLLAMSLAACGHGDAKVKPADVDQDAPATATEQEAAAFTAPRDSVISDEQVAKYLKTSLLQFDLIRKESGGIHDKIAEMDKRAKDGGTLAALRNIADAGSTMAHAGDLIGGSYVRSARSLGYNPAEMEWVRDRMGEVGAYLTAKPMLEMQVQAAQQMRAQAEQMKAQAGSGYSAADLQQLTASANEMEANAKGADQARSVMANVAVLHRARPAVSEPMWTTITFAGGALGMASMAGFADPNNQETQKKLDELRTVYQAALDNRVAPGMENKPAPAPAH